MTNISKIKQTQADVKWEFKERPIPPTWINPAIASGWFIGLFLIWGMYTTTQITIIETFKWYFLFATVITILPYRLILKVIFLEYTYWIVANVVGIGPLVTGLFLLLNFLFSYNPTTTKYAIEKVPRPEPRAVGPTTIILENNTLEHHPKFRTFDFHEIVFQKSVTYTFEDGLFGYPILKDINTQ